MDNFGPSLIRTIVPIVVSQLVALAAKHNLDASGWTDVLSQAIGAVVATGYYAGVRWLETKVRPKFGWLLGKATAPTYTPAPVGPDGGSDVPSL